jgi:flagellar hook-basal body complex protein FliE
MADPLGLISGGAGGASRAFQAAQNRAGVGTNGAAGGAAGDGPDFKKVLLESLGEVNKAQQEADRAAEDLATGDRSDVENVILATQKADNAFRMLQALRNKVVEAYDEIKQVRV